MMKRNPKIINQSSQYLSKSSSIGQEISENSQAMISGGNETPPIYNPTNPTDPGDTTDGQIGGL